MKEIDVDDAWDMARIIYFHQATLKQFYIPQDVDYEREVQIIKEASMQQRHPNMVHTYGVFDITEAKVVGIAMELCDCSLKNFLKQRQEKGSLSPMPLEAVADFMTQILTGLSYIHAKNIMHR